MFMLLSLGFFLSLAEGTKKEVLSSGNLYKKNCFLKDGTKIQHSTISSKRHDLKFRYVETPTSDFFYEAILMFFFSAC